MSRESIVHSAECKVCLPPFHKGTFTSSFLKKFIWWWNNGPSGNTYQLCTPRMVPEINVFKNTHTKNDSLMSPPQIHLSTVPLAL